MHFCMRAALALAFLAAVPAMPARAQDPAGPVGHWEGAIVTPNGDLGINVDLAVDESGVWSGDISIPAQGLQDFALSEVTVEGRAVSFKMAGIPGDPAFSGSLSDDGQSITGIFTQGPAQLEFKLVRKPV